MNDSPGDLERELRAMRPRALNAQTLDTLSRTMSQKASRLSDWCLMGAMGSGLAAAVVIVAMLSLNSSVTVDRGMTAAPVAQVAPQRAGDSLMMFARADDNGDGFLK